MARQTTGETTDGKDVRRPALPRFIGILPAIGGRASGVMAYDHARKFSKTPELFGGGHPDGIIAAEACNNANVSGSLMTMMAVGSPGDAVTAVMLGAMTIHDIQSGPLFIFARKSRIFELGF